MKEILLYFYNIVVDKMIDENEFVYRNRKYLLFKANEVNYEVLKQSQKFQQFFQSLKMKNTFYLKQIAIIEKSHFLMFWIY